MEYFQFSFYFQFPSCFSLISIIFYMVVIKKMKTNVLWEMPVTGSLSRSTKTFRTMDRLAHTNKFLRKGLIIVLDGIIQFRRGQKVYPQSEGNVVRHKTDANLH